MTLEQQSTSTPGLGRRTSLILGLIVFVCLAFIGFSGFLKYQLDRSEAVLAAPSSALVGEFEALDKLRRAFGYSGFVGLAQNFAGSHDINLLPDMRAQIKIANDVLGRLPERMPAESRHDLQAIVATYEGAMLKAEKSVSDGNASFSVLDVEPLYATLPILDSRLESATSTRRLMAHDDAEFWGMILTLLTWCSLILAASMVAGIYLMLMSRQSAPMRALSQSVRNLARGDIRTSIWGMERQDIVGELARAIDTARYHFSQLPDMSLMSDKGPVRLRFEGNTRSLFEAMMTVLGKDSENVRTQAAALSESIAKQHEVMTLLSSRVDAVLHNIENRGMDGDRQVRDILNHMLNSAEQLKNAQEHAADQLNRIIPYLQERAQGMADITQIAGKQIAQTLQSLTLSERGLKTSTEQSNEAIHKLAATADDLGGRLFGAVNLLQASGKVLAETTETTQSRLNEVIDQVAQGININYKSAPAEAIESKLPPSILPRIEEAVSGLEAARKTLEDRIAEQTGATKAQIELLTTHSSGLLSQTTTMTQTLSSASNNLRDKQAQFDDIIALVTSRLDDITASIEKQASVAIDKTHAFAEHNLAELAAKTDAHVKLEHEKLDVIVNKTRDFAERSLSDIASRTEALVQSEHEKIDAVLNKTSAFTEQSLSTLVRKTDEHIRSEQTKFDDILQQVTTHLHAISTRLEKQAEEALHRADTITEKSLDELSRLSDRHQKSEQERYDTIAQHVSERIETIGRRLEDEVSSTFAKAGTLTENGLKNITQLTRELVQDEQAKFTEVISQVSAHLHDISNNLEHQVDATNKKTQTFTEQNLTQLATLTAQHLRHEQTKFDDVIHHITNHLEAIATRIDERSNDVFNITNSVSKQSLQELTSLTSQFVRDEQSKFDRVVDQVATRLNDIGTRFEKQALESFGHSDELVKQSVSNLSQLSSQLAQLSDKMAALDITTSTIAHNTSLEPAFAGKLTNEIRNSVQSTAQFVDGLKSKLDKWAEDASFITPEFMNKMRDHWYHMAGQIEATRTDLTKVVTEQVSHLEKRLEGLDGKSSLPSLQDDSQKVMEQQTQILAELVVTMGLLDSHMQDIEKKLAMTTDHRVAS